MMTSAEYEYMESRLWNQAGIGEKYHNRSLKEVPEAYKWLNDSSDGDKFKDGKCGLICVGGVKAVEAATLIERWLVLIHSSGFCTDLVSLSELLSLDVYKLSEDELENREDRINSTTLLINHFQGEGECPISSTQSNKIRHYLEKRIDFKRYSHTILHITQEDLSWWSTYLKEFLDVHFVWMKCE